MAKKIHDIRTDWRLAAKTRAVHSMCADRAPDNSFGICRIAAQSARAGSCRVRDLPDWLLWRFDHRRSRSPSLTLPRKRGRGRAVPFARSDLPLKGGGEERPRRVIG